VTFKTILYVIRLPAQCCKLGVAVIHCGVPTWVQANYINALAVSVSPFFEPAKVTLGGLIFSPWVDFLMTLGGLIFSIW
jgi:hypothetical protein